MSSAINSSAIDKVLQDAVASGAVPHVAAIAADRDGVIYRGAAGPRAVGESDPVTDDTLFRIMSMTKMPCTVAALQQVEQGNLGLDAPVAEYCPEFAELQVLTGFDGDTPVTQPPASQATVRNLITHTAGLGYWFWDDQLARWESATGTPNVVTGSGASLTAPLLADPGTAFVYGINIDWLGKVVEAATGTSLDVTVKEGITGPLGMDQTTFLMSDQQRPKCTAVHVKGEDGTWVSIGEVLNQSPDWWPADTGCTARPATTSSSSGRYCAAASWTALASCASQRWTQPSATRSATWTSRSSCRPSTPRRPIPSGSARASSGATACCSTPRISPACAGPGRAAGRGCATRISGWTGRRHLRFDLQQFPALRPAGGRRAVQRLRKGALRLAVAVIPAPVAAGISAEPARRRRTPGYRAPRSSPTTYADPPR